MQVAETQNRTSEAFRNGVATLTMRKGYRLLERQDLAPRIHLLRIDAPSIARKAQAGQFVILRMDENGERIPLTIADWDSERGDITLVFMEVGASTMMLATLEAGDCITDLAGPLGLPSHIKNFGHVICIAGGVGVAPIAPIAPIARALREAGNRVTCIAGARSFNMLFWEDRLKAVSDRLIVTSDDGSYGVKGLVTKPLAEILQAETYVEKESHSLKDCKWRAFQKTLAGKG